MRRPRLRLEPQANRRFSARSSSMCFFSSAAQGFGWVGARFLTCLSIHDLHLFSYHTTEMPGSHCSSSAAALQVFWTVLPNSFTNCPQTVNSPSPHCLSTPWWSFLSGKPAKTLCLWFSPSLMHIGQQFQDCWGLQRELLELLWSWGNPGFALEGRIFSEQRSGIRLGFRNY